MELEFFEKPGCKSNTKQKALLTQAGVKLIVHDLLQHPFTKAELAAFFSGMPVTEWFNPTAPAIKEGKVRPEELTSQEALLLMLEQRLLIRRPLLRLSDKQTAGFYPQQLEETFGISLTHLLSKEEKDRFHQQFVACRGTSRKSQ